MVSLKIYNDTYWRLVSFNDKILYNNSSGRRKVKNKGFYDDITTITDKEEIERISLSRTKRHIKEICLCNNFEYFFTSTVSSKNADRFSLQECQDKITKLCKKIKRSNNEFKYIFITEEHKKGGFHFHGFIKGIPKNDIYVNSNGYLSSHYFDTIGFNSFDKIRDYNKACNYITKYISKKCIKNENNQIYFCSRGLKRCDEEIMIPKDLKEIFGDNIFTNDYCQIKDFDITKLSENQRINLLAYFDENDKILQNDNNYITNWLKLFTNKFINVNIRL